MKFSLSLKPFYQRPLSSTILLIALVSCVSCMNGNSNLDGKNTVVYPADQDIKFSVMSFNLLFGGGTTGATIDDAAALIELSGADIVALQEHVTNGPKIAKALGWDSVAYGVDNAIISRYNITEVLKNGVKIEFNPGNEIVVFVVHLDPYPYGPYNLRDKPELTEADLVAEANKARAKETNNYIAAAQPYIDSGIPVFFIGDFNEPSHLDWTTAAVDAGLRTKKIAWPTSVKMTNAGYNDAYRAVYPDPVSNPGNTWTPFPSDNEVHDRIDFVYYQGSNLSITTSQLAGPAGDAGSEISYEPYPSDHRTVIAEMLLDVTP